MIDASSVEDNHSEVSKELLGGLYRKTSKTKRDRSSMPSRRAAKNKARDTKTLISVLGGGSSGGEASFSSSNTAEKNGSMTRLLQFDASQTDNLTYIEVERNWMDSDINDAMLRRTLRRAVVHDFLQQMLESDEQSSCSDRSSRNFKTLKKEDIESSRSSLDETSLTDKKKSPKKRLKERVQRSVSSLLPLFGAPERFFEE